jgi:hypothetical protein
MSSDHSHEMAQRICDKKGLARSITGSKQAAKIAE